MVNNSCSSMTQVWRVSGNEKILIPASDQSKFYSGDCYIFQYSYPGDDRDEYLIGTWFGKQSVEVIMIPRLLMKKSQAYHSKI